jgi:hypothetical protein
MDLPMRFAWPAARTLQLFCDETLEGYEDELIKAIVRTTTETELVQQMCGKVTR